MHCDEAHLGKVKQDWQKVEGILGMFGDNKTAARRGNKAFVDKGFEQGKRHDLIGGGLIRSAGRLGRGKSTKKGGNFSEKR
jgi:hypothetical protein